MNETTKTEQEMAQRTAATTLKAVTALRDDAVESGMWHHASFYRSLMEACRKHAALAASPEPAASGYQNTPSSANGTSADDGAVSAPHLQAGSDAGVGVGRQTASASGEPPEPAASEPEQPAPPTEPAGKVAQWTLYGSEMVPHKDGGYVRYHDHAAALAAARAEGMAEREKWERLRQQAHGLLWIFMGPEEWDEKRREAMRDLHAALAALPPAEQAQRSKPFLNMTSDHGGETETGRKVFARSCFLQRLHLCSSRHSPATWTTPSF